MSSAASVVLSGRRFAPSELVGAWRQEICLASLSRHTCACHVEDSSCSNSCCSPLRWRLSLKRRKVASFEVLHVGTEPGLFHGTLYDNLIFGVAEGARFTFPSWQVWPLMCAVCGNIMSTCVCADAHSQDADRDRATSLLIFNDSLSSL